jgi:hypothetical protein
MEYHIIEIFLLSCIKIPLKKSKSHFIIPEDPAFSTGGGPFFNRGLKCSEKLCDQS